MARTGAGGILRCAAVAVVLALAIAAPASARDWTAPGAVEPWIGVATDEIAQAQMNPPRASRLLGLVSVAARDAEVASRPLGRGAAHPAIAAAVTATLVELEPAREAALEALEDEAIAVAVSAGLVDGSRARLAEQVGRLAALRAIVRSRTDDADATGPVAPPAGPGYWVATPPAYAPPLEPVAGTWRPWNLQSGDELRPPPPPRPPSTAYTAEVRAVYDTVQHLTPEQTAIARFWADGAGTVTPPGHWNLIALDLVRTAPRSPAAATRLFAALNTAQADAFIACWAAKYQYWTERPVTAIRRTIDPDWLPLLVTPPFPSYPSGHATTSAAAATVLGTFFPERADALDAMADEAAVSRIYGGIHFPVDSEGGLSLGRQVGVRALTRWR